MAGALGCYVYALVDPRDNRAFYVGKGVGDRVFQHSKGKLTEDSQSLELDTISSILRAGKAVHCYILRHKLSEQTARAEESRFIGLWSKDSNMDNLLTNIVSMPHK